MKTTFRILTLCAAVAACAPAAAEKEDRNKPMNIEADSLRMDEARQIRVFSGRVVVTKGSIVIRGTQLEVREDPQGFQFGTITGTSTERAYFRQKRDGVDETIEGEAQTVEYDGRQDSVKFSGQALLRRLRGTVVADEISGAIIQYNSATSMFSVDGSPANAAAGQPQGRVRATLSPKPDTAQPAPAKPASGPPAKPASPQRGAAN